MKKIFFFCISLLTVISAQGQVNHFSKADSKWFVRDTYINTSPYDLGFIGVYTTVYGFKGDTTINGNSWFKMYSTNDSSFTNNLNLEGYIYSHNEIVEFIHPDGKLDTLYDFSMGMNDSIYFTFKWNHRPDQYMKPDSIDSISIGGVQYTRINFMEPTGPSAMDYLGEKWIWGIGSIHGPLHPIYLHTYSGEDGDANETDLTCTHHSDTLLYKSEYQCYQVKKNDWKSWYKIGTTWHVNESYNYPNKIEQGYEKLTVTKDTTVAGRSARLIERVSYTNKTEKLKPIIVYEENGKAYFWNNSSFQLMYDFNLAKGDTLHKLGAGGGCDSAIVLVDSTSTLRVGGDVLKVQHLNVYSYIDDSLYPGSVPYEIIERVGFAFVWVNGGTLEFNPEPLCVMADNSWHDGSLRCFEEPNGLNYNAKPELSSCDLITSNISLTQGTISLSPNPTQSITRILGINHNVHYTVIDINGSQVLSGFSNYVDMINLSKGTYFLSFQYENKSYVKKIVKL